MAQLSFSTQGGPIPYLCLELSLSGRFSPGAVDDLGEVDFLHLLRGLVEEGDAVDDLIGLLLLDELVLDGFLFTVELFLDEGLVLDVPVELLGCGLDFGGLLSDEVVEGLFVLW